MCDGAIIFGDLIGKIDVLRIECGKAYSPRSRPLLALRYRIGTSSRRLMSHEEETDPSPQTPRPISQGVVSSIARTEERQSERRVCGHSTAFYTFGNSGGIGLA
jgi:hypothetical protein